MCGICGATHDPEGLRVRAMNARMVHRGPDDEGVYIDARSDIALGARRLSVIDPAGGHQPIANEDKTIWAVLNGEIYNYRDVRDHLLRSGHRLRTATDTEVLVHLYEDHGDSLVDLLDGMFAFAVWDVRKRRLLLARDRFGEKPLFYRHNGAVFTFASELTALRAGLAESVDVDPNAMDAYLVLGYVPGEQSIFRGVKRVMAGTTLCWSPDHEAPELKTYWKMPSRTRLATRSLGEYAEEAEGLIRRSVSSRLHADVPVGVMLSSGIDSNLVAAVVADLGAPALRTFTVAYDTGSFSEAAAARDTAKRLGSEHHECMVTSNDVAQRVPKVLGALDIPNGDPALIALHAVSELARESVTVVLGGEGADELFGGYPRYRWIARAEQIASLVPPSAGRAAAHMLRRGGDRASRLADVVAPLDLCPRQIQWVGTGIHSLRHSLYGERLRVQLGQDAALADATTVLGSERGEPPQAALMRLDQHRYLVDDVLAKADRATMQVSLEMRSPFLSRDLAEFSASIPAEIHTSHGGKSVLRTVAGKMVAVGSARRAKTAFRVPLAEWLRGPLSPLVTELAARSRLVREGWLSGPELSRMITANQRGEQNHSLAVWTILVAELSLWDGLA